MKNLIIIFTIALAIASCKRPTQPIGPEYFSASSDFHLVGDGTFKSTATTKALDLTKVKGGFSAEFSEKVSWTVTLTGLTSGAVKTFTGVSDKIDPATIAWNGGHEGIYFFRRLEKVVASLTVLGLDASFKDTVTLTQERNYLVKGKVVPILNFESLNFQYNFFDGPTDYGRDYTTTYPVRNDSLSDMMKASNNAKSTFIKGLNGDTILGERTVEGRNSYYMAGTDGTYRGSTQSDYFLGGAGTALSPTTMALDKDPKNVYFNIFIFGTGDKNSKLGVNFDEDDGKVDATGKVVYDNVANQQGLAKNYVLDEDEYTCTFEVDWVGWRMVSINYSQLVLSGAGATALRGNKILEPHRVAKIGINLLSNYHTKASVMFDYAVFTVGAPFNPND